MTGQHFDFRFSRVYRRAKRFIFSRLYADRHPDSRNSILVAGTARSGTTWVGDLIATQVNARILFEPFHPGKVKEYRPFETYQYLRPDEEHAGLQRYAEKLFSGTIRNSWIDREVSQLRPAYRIIKAVRANMILKWLDVRFPQVPKLLVLRHPCATFLSWQRLGWDPAGDLNLLLVNQTALIRDYISQKLDTVRAYTTAEEQFAAFWCIQNLVPIRQFQAGTLPVVFYENLCTAPADEIPRLFEMIRLPFRSDVFQALEKPSTTAKKYSAVLTGGDKISGWQDQLPEGQADRILNVVAYFGLDDVYDASPMPPAQALR